MITLKELLDVEYNFQNINFENLEREILYLCDIMNINKNLVSVRFKKIETTSNNISVIIHSLTKETDELFEKFDYITFLKKYSIEMSTSYWESVEKNVRDKIHGNFILITYDREDKKCNCEMNVLITMGCQCKK